MLSAGLHAIPISGTFNIGGTATVTSTTLSWVDNNSPFPPQVATIGPGGTGNFSLLGGSTVNITNLTNPPAVVDGAGISPPIDFIHFNSPLAVGFPDLNLNFIAAGIFGPGQCATLPPSVGQTCTPPNPGGSPFNLVNNPPAGSPQANVTFVFSGVTSDGLENWQGIFTSQFTVPYQTVLAQLAAGGSVTNTYSATFTLTPIPEAGTMSLLGLGLVAISLKFRRRN
jgi:hypothetical protein